MFSPWLEWPRTCPATWWIWREDPGGRKTLSILESESIQVRGWLCYMTYTRKSTASFHMGHNFLQFYIHFWSFSELWVTGWHDFSGGWLTEKRLFLSFIYIFGTILWRALLLRFSEAGLEHRWKKKGMKFYTLKYSIKIYIVSLVTWCLSNTLHGRISKPLKPHNCIRYKCIKAIICEKINQTA